MIAATWTMRLAAMLKLELSVIATEDAALALDGGLGLAAVAAISALPPGPRRNFELAMWARRIVDGPGRLAVVFRPDADDATYEAYAALAYRCRQECEVPR
jgi:hypothetical protein